MIASLFLILIKAWLISSSFVPKCCPTGYLKDQNGCEINNGTEPEPETWKNLELSYSGGLDCPSNMTYVLEENEYNLQPDGKISFENKSAEFCVEKVDIQGYVPFVCVNLDENDDPPVVYPLGMIISIPFLLATWAIYVGFKKLHSLHGKCLIHHVTSLILGYVSLTIVQLTTNGLSDIACIILGFAVQFFFLATFFWLNVMCIDIYWAFSGIKSFRGSASERDRKKLLFYSAYAWGMPLLILTATVAIDYSDSIPESSHFKPNMGKDKCFFKNRIATWTYLYCPMALILFTNLVLFGVTAFRIWRHRRETAVLQRGDSRRHDGNDSERFVLYLKLFSVMGINWLSELVSFMFGSEVPQYLWYITDITNTLQGVFIFLIFVWKKRVRKLLWDKMCKSSNKTKGTSTAVNTTSSVLVLSS